MTFAVKAFTAGIGAELLPSEVLGPKEVREPKVMENPKLG